MMRSSDHLGLRCASPETLDSRDRGRRWVAPTAVAAAHDAVVLLV